MPQVDHRGSADLLGAFAVQDIGCIRYKGKSRVVQIRLIGAGQGDPCDHLPRDLDSRNDEVQEERSRLA